MRFLAFTIVALCALVFAYGIGLGGAVSALIFLFVLFNGVLDRVAQPLLARLRP